MIEIEMLLFDQLVVFGDDEVFFQDKKTGKRISSACFYFRYKLISEQLILGFFDFHQQLMYRSKFRQLID